MAIGFSDPRAAMGYNDAYDGMRYYEQQERRYREERLRQQQMAMQNIAYNPYTQSQQGVTDLEREQKAVEPDYLKNEKLLLLGEAS